MSAVDRLGPAAGAPSANPTAETPADLVEPPVRLPVAPAPPANGGFPVIAVLAPVGIGLALFAIIGAPFLLLLAVFGPVIAIAHVVDRRVGGRRRHRRALAEFATALEGARQEIAAAHARLRRRRRAAHPLARDLVTGASRTEPGIVLGLTAVPSGLRVEGGGADPALDALRREAARLDSAPHALEAGRVRVLGPRTVVAGAVRALVVQLTADDPAAPLDLRGEVGGRIAAELAACGVDPVGAEEECARWIDTDEGAEAADAVLRLRADGGGECAASDGRAVRLRVDGLGAGELRRWAPTIAAARRARTERAGRLPERCELDDLPAADDDAARTGLPAVLGVADDGPLAIDLVADGPHAVIGGTTGSGKSELLVAWATSIARARTSDECLLLCLDFKGGATFDALAELPHCVGIVTDLDDGEARRVLAGLRAEVRRRELRLRELGIRDLAEAPGAEPRLVVLVDEFQALVQEHPELTEIFADLAARGRSLGVHLVLCTQRPTGVFRESLLANCSIRISLRVEQASDSRTLLGVDDAARLPVDRRGRALVRLGGAPRAAQIALAGAATVAAVAAREQERRRRAGLGAPARPWRPPLPERLSLEPGRWALADEPDAQRQPRLGPPADGDHLWVLGAQRTGKSTALAAVVAAARHEGRRAIVLGDDPERAWDLVAELVEGPPAGPLLLVADDLDALEQRFDGEHRAAFVERLVRLARDGRRRRCTLVVATRGLTGPLQRLHALARSTLRLAAASRQEWLLQGGESGHWLGDAPPGRGRLDGRLVQVAAAGAGTLECGAIEGGGAPAARPFALPAAGLAVAARRTAGIRAAAVAAGRAIAEPPTPAAAREGVDALLAGAPVRIGDLDQWHAAFGALPRLGERVPVLVVGAGAGEWRNLFRADPMPPAVADHWSTGLLRHPNGRVERVELDDGAPVRIRPPHRLDAAPARYAKGESMSGAKRFGTPAPSAA